MILHDCKQGSEEWLSLRRGKFTASEAPAMMGDSSHMSRDELLRLKATGLEREIDARTQDLFDRGHASEAAARSAAENAVDEDLYPVTCEEEIDGMMLLASLDGVTMGWEDLWEHKMGNAALVEMVRQGALSPAYFWQLEHQLLVTDADRVLFTAGSGPDMASMWYASNPERRAQLIAGWKQFAADLKEWSPRDDTPAPVAADPETLPALLVEISGRILRSNLATWQAAIVGRIQAISTDLHTDEDFAIAERTVKFLDDGERRLDLVKSQAQAQAKDIDKLFRTIDALKAEMRAKRLSLDKLVKARKEAIRTEVVMDAQRDIASHVAALNERIGRYWMPPIQPDFAGAIKGKRTVTSLRDAVESELVRAKLAANETADRIERNIKALEEVAGDMMALFPDAQSMCTSKTTEDLVAVARQRIADAKAAEARRIEAERERIRAEEQAKARRIEADRERIRAEEQAKVAAPAPERQPAADNANERIRAEEIKDAELKVAVDNADERVKAFLASRSWERDEELRALALLIEYELFLAEREQAQ